MLIFVAIAVIAVQSALIAALLIGYFRLRRTERSLKESEARWRSVVDNPIFGVSFVDPQHRFIATNPTYQRMLGYTDEELRQLTPLDISVPGEREANETLFKELQQGQRQHFEMVKQLRRKDGSLIWIQLYVFAIPDAATKTLLSFGMMQDISASKRAQDELEATRAELARVARMSRLGAMTATIAHEINQPLGAMVANANAALRWLARSPPDLVEVETALRRIGSDGQRAAEVIRGIRAMFESSAQNRVPLDINQLLREVIALVRGDLFKHRIAVQTGLAKKLPEIMADRVQLQQVVMNLITNAIDAMKSIPDRQHVLRVTSAQDSTPDGDKLRVTIEDTGSGIDPDKVERLFDPLFTTKAHGMGMGLAICRSIIEAHNGHLSASRGAEYGSVFWFELPVE